MIGTAFESRIGRRLLGASATIVAFSVVSKLLGVVQQAVVAAEFGTGRSLDVYFIASSITNFFSNVLLLGTLGSVFVSAFAVARRRGGQDGAWSFTSGILVVSITAMTVVSVLLILTAPFVVALLAPGFSPTSQAEATRVFRLMSPVLILTAAAAVFSGTLFAHQKFAIPLLSFNVTAICLIASLLWLSQPLGIYSFVIGLIGGTAFSLAVFVYGLRSIGFRWHFVRDDLRSSLGIIAPMSAGMFVVAAASESVRLGARLFASYLPAGSISTFEYGLLFERIIVGLFAVAIATAIYPVLADAASDLPSGHFRTAFRTALRYVAVVTIPLTGLVIIVRQDLIRIWLERGSFHLAQTKAVSTLLVFLSAGLVAWAFLQVIVYAYLAMNTIKPLIIGMTGNALLAALLYWPLGHLFGVNGIALSVSVAAALASVLMWIHLEAKLGKGKFALRRLAFPAAISLATVAAMVACFGAVSAIGRLPLGGGVMSATIAATVGPCLGTAVYLLVAYALGVHEIRSLATAATGRLRRLSAGRNSV